jgi:hypothetical protein
MEVYPKKHKGFVIVATKVATGLFVLIPVASLCQTAFSMVKPSLAEFAERDRWVTNTFPIIESPSGPDIGLIVKSNLIPVQLNAWIGEPFTIGKTRYYRGLFCQAYSEILVRLLAPGKTFDAMLGVDSNGSGTGCKKN